MLKDGHPAQNLARLVPSLAQARRLSKVLIVNESIKHLRQRRSLCISASRDMQELLMENSRLASELNAMRAQIGVPAIAPVEPKPATGAMLQLMDIENEEAGEFPEGFGQSWAGRSSPPSKDKGAQSESETRSAPASTPERNDAQYTQPPVQNANAPLGYSESAVRDLQQSLPRDWDTDLAFSNQPEALLAPDSELFNPTGDMSLNQTGMSGYLDEPVGASPMDLLSQPWTEALCLDYQSPGDTTRSQQAGNQNFEDLWNFWVRPGTVTS